MDDQLTAQVALVSGAGRGIGRAIAIGLASDGMAIALTARHIEQLEETAQLVGAAGGRALPVPGDIADPAFARRLVDLVTQTLGPVDLLVNNAAAIESSETTLWDADLTEWWRVVEINLRGPVMLSAAVIPAMLQRGKGCIVNMGSLAATRTSVAYSAYGASKAALMRVTDSLHASLIGTGVTVFDVSPGLVRTAMTEAMPIWANVPDEGWTPVSRVVELVKRLASGHADELSGRFIHALDDLDDLVAKAPEVESAQGRTLRLKTYSADDPLPV